MELPFELPLTAVNFPPPDLIASCYAAERDCQRTDRNQEDSLQTLNTADSSPQFIESGTYDDQDSWVVIHDWFSLPKVREVENTLIALQCSKNPNIITDTLNTMLGFFSDEEKLGYLDERKAHSIILQAMARFLENAPIQKNGCILLKRFMEESQECRWELQYFSCHKHLLNIFYEHTSDEELQLVAIQLTLLVTSSADVQREILRRGGANKLAVILATMRKFRKNAEITKCCCKLLKQFLTQESICQEFLQHGAYSVLIEVLLGYVKHESTTLQLLDVMKLLIPEDSMTSKLHEDSIHLQTLSLMRSCRKQDMTLNILLDYLKLLRITNNADENVAKTLMEQEIQDDLLDILNTVEQNDVILECLRITLQICEYLFPTLRWNISQATKWFDTLHQKLWQCLDQPEIQFYCCHVTSKLLETLPWLIDNIGEEVNQVQLHNACFGTILIYSNKKHPHVFASACELTFWVSAAKASIQNILMSKNVYVGILLGLTMYKEHPMCVASGCKALRGLCVFSQEHKYAIVQTGPLTLLLESMVFHLENVTAVMEVVALTACLSECKIFKNQCLLEGCHKIILSALETHQDDAFFTEVCLEALASLCSADGGPDLLLGSQVLEVVLSVTEKHSGDEMIQMKGLMILQLLLHAVELDHCELVEDITKCLTTAMISHPTALGVQIEGLVLMIIMVTLREDLAQNLIELDFMGVILGLLKVYANFQGLQDLAIEAFAVLCTNKNRMLQHSCSLEYTHASECLVLLGADVNTSSGEETPLCSACKHKNIHMVSILLQQGVHDFHTPLKLALEMDSNSMIGKILCYLGYDKETGNVCWSGLDLCELRPGWITPTFLYDKDTKAQCSEESHFLAEKVKACQAKRSVMLTRASQEVQDIPVSKHYYLSENIHRFSSLSLCSEITDILNEDTLAPPGGNRADGGRRLGLTSSSVSSDTQTMKRTGSVDDLNDHSISPLLDDYKIWKTTTISGANITYSYHDPRRFIEWSHGQQPMHSLGHVAWGRKSIQACTFEKKLGDLLPSPKLAKKMRQSASEPNLWRVKNQMKRRSRKDSFDIAILEGEEVPSYSGVEAVQFYLPEDDMSSMEGFTTTASNAMAEVPDMGHMWERLGKPQRRLSGEEEPVMLSTALLTCLDVSNNALHDLESVAQADYRLLERFHHLHSLDFSSNKLEEMPDILIQNLPNLENLNISNNHLKSFPPKLSNCTKLKTLNLSNNEIADVSLGPDKKLVHLKEVNLSHNKLPVFPQHLSRVMPDLEILILSRNCLTELPETELQMSKLEKLDLSFNSLDSFPEWFLVGCTSLASLLLHRNNLEFLPPEAVASILKELHTLNVSHNNLGPGHKHPFYIPKFVLKLESLKYLNMSFNQLEGFPSPDMLSTTNLRELEVSHNGIQTLPISHHSKHWATLDRLNLSYNSLKRLPKEIGQLSCLSSLNISHNPNITSIPDEMGKLTRLWELNVEGLKLDLDSSLLRGRTRDLVGYLLEKLKRSVEYNHMKLMLVGYGGRGKSTLLRSLMRQKHVEKSAPTVGVVVKNWRFSTWKRASYVTYSLSCWDFAGQEEFYSKHQYFLSNRAVYLVVYNLGRGLSELNTIKPWLVNIKAVAPSCPVIMVGTHKDTVPADMRDNVIREMRTKMTEMSERPGYPEIKGMVELCANQENPNIEKLRIIIKQVLDGYKVKGQSVMGQKVPASFVTLQELLMQERQALQDKMPIVNYSRLWQIVQDAQLDLDEEELKQAVKFLHEAGVILHYEDPTMHLNQLYFLDPEWLCRMMAQIVTVREINPFINSHGVMKKKDLRLLFTGRKVGDNNRSFTFPPTFIPHYLKLLERFQIAMPLNEEELLIPSRLSPQKPEYSLPVKGNGGHEGACLIRRWWEMQYIPIGFGTRLLIRLIMFARNMHVQHDYGNGVAKELVYWRKGIYVCFEEHAFFQLVSFVKGDIHCMELSVPPTRHGASLLGQVVDHIDAMVEEWFPGLLEVTPTGDSPMEGLVPCIQCNPTRMHVFKLNQLVARAEHEDFIACPNHEENAPLRLLAPDIVLGDMEPFYHISHADLRLVQSSDNLLGDGSFGKVYKGMYKGRAVAVKVFMQGETPLHTLLRQEATILQMLQHPSLVSMVGVALRPWVLVLELAPMGSLGTLLKEGFVLNRIMQHRIALQVADGLQYLHSREIVYRDMKPDNLLIFNITPTAAVIAKISDYGISRVSAPYGILGAEGTPGYRAPEVILGQSYRFQADVYSFGVTLYQLVTKGKHPYQNAESTNELDDAVLRNAPLQSIVDRGISPWPDMEDLINLCCQHNVDSRPTSAQMFLKFSKADLLSLRYVVPVSRGLAVECMAAVPVPKGGIELWFTCSDTECCQLSWMGLSRGFVNPRGTMFTESRILCMTSLGTRGLVVGTQSGSLYIYDVIDHKYHCALPPLSDAVLSLLHYVSPTRDILLAGTGDGQVAIFSTNAALTGEGVFPKVIQIANPREPIMSMCIHSASKKNGRIFICAGSKVHLLKVEPQMKYEKLMDTCNKERGNSGVICSMVRHERSLFIIKRGSSVLEQWNYAHRKLANTLKLDEYLMGAGEKLMNQSEARILSIASVNKQLIWLGTASGHIVLVNIDKLGVEFMMRRHTGPVRAMLCIPKSPGLIFGTSVVIAAGMGFVSDGLRSNPDDGYVSFWDSELNHTCKMLNKHLKQRQALMKKSW